jgi:tetratricopeptide (TPR) repeat protein
MALVLSAVSAYAADQPRYEPPGSWVKQRELPKVLGPDTGTPTRLILEDLQANFADGARETYAESISKIQTPQGLSGIGNLALNWKPDTDTLTIHRLHIIRGDQVIDLLADGHVFTVLRRENNLEMAMLDGALTAAIEPEGLQVGDLIDFSFTLKRVDPVLQGVAELSTGNLLLTPIDHLMVREIWPKSKTLRFRQTDGLTEAKLDMTATGSELTITMDNTQPPKGPKGAPARYFQLGEIEGTEFRSWAEVSALMAPLFEKASTLGPQSPLKAEAAKIKAASGDPKIQAMAALKLVEDQIRYLFLGMNNGGYIPADADQTWSRRFGDCKGKTAALIALLHELGIEAEPALANIMAGDGMDERLPMLEAFDHVLVRAVIAGKVYWLDGTRSGDRNLDDLQVPAFHWVLPVQKSGAALVRLTLPVPEKPLNTIDFQIDASAGLDAPASVHAVSIFRGDSAIALNLRAKSSTPTDLDKNMRDYWKKALDWVEITKVDAVYDEATGEERVTMDGSGAMDWKRYLGGSDRQYQIDESALGWKPDYDREPGSKLDAPFAVPFPFFGEAKETIRLPNGGAGFTIDATDVDKTTAGMEFKRVASIENGVFTMTTTTKALVPEFPAADAAQAKKELRELRDVAVYLHAPRTYAPHDETVSKNDDEAPTTAAEFIDQGNDFHRQRKYDDAIADFSRALALEPDSSRAHANRGLAYLSKGGADPDAQSDFTEALKLDAKNADAMRGDAILLSNHRRFDEAVNELSQAISINPNDQWAFLWRAITYARMNKRDQANADFDQAIKLKPDQSETYRFRAQYLLYLHKGKEALADLDKTVPIGPNDHELHQMRAVALTLVNRKADADAELAQMLPAMPTAESYLLRASIRDPSDLDGKLADADAALKLQQGSTAAVELKINVEIEKGEIKDAVAILDHAIELNPDDVGLLRRRATMRADAHQLDLAVEDFDRIAAKKPGNLDGLLDACRAKALAGKNFDGALADCQAALKLDPASDEAKEARGFIYLRFGHFDAAIADYDDVLQRRPNSPTALFGRGLAEFRNGVTGSGQADLDAARRKNANIDTDFTANPAARVSAFDLAIESAWIEPPPTTADMFAARGAERTKGQNYDLAIADFSLALKLDPGSAQAYAGRGMAYLRKGCVDQGAADFEKALQIEPNQITAQTGQAYIAQRNGDSAKAIALFGHILELKPDEAEARVGRAELLASLHQYDDALKDLTTVLDKTPDNPVWLNNRCWYRAISGKELDEALIDCDTSLKIKEMPGTRDSRGLVNLRLGKFDDAVADYNRALSQRPNLPSSLFGRGIAKIRKGAASDGQADISAALVADPKVVTEFADYGVKQ